MRLSNESEKRLRSLIAKHQLEAAEEEIVSHAVECVVLTRGEPEDYSAVGNSRYGGVPDLPPSIPWPTGPGFPDASGACPCFCYNFLMQVNLGDVPLVEGSPLPSSGMLYYFIGLNESCIDVQGKVIFYDGDPRDLSRGDQPATEMLLNENYVDLKPHKLRPYLGIDLPGYGTDVFFVIAEKGGTTSKGDGGDRYFKLIDEAVGKSSAVEVDGQLLGHPSELISDMREDAFLVRTGREDKVGTPGYSTEHAAEMREGAKQWVQLWRIESDFAVGTCFWDAGNFNVLIREEDLVKGDFSGIYTQLETS